MDFVQSLAGGATQLIERLKYSVGLLFLAFLPVNHKYI
jgi:hypothetical protein